MKAIEDLAYAIYLEAAYSEYFRACVGRPKNRREWYGYAR